MRGARPGEPTAAPCPLWGGATGWRLCCDSNRLAGRILLVAAEMLTGALALLMLGGAALGAAGVSVVAGHVAGG